MTNDQTVTQADRDAAADLCERIKNDKGEAVASWAIDLIRAGKADHHCTVQAFARHRTAHSGEANGDYAEAFDILVDVQSALVLTAEHSQGTSVASFVSSSTEYDRLSKFLQAKQHDDPHAHSGEGRSNDDVLRCDDCGCANPVWFAPSDVWNLVVGGPDATDDPGGVLCPICFIAKAEAAGIKPNGWRIEPEGRSNEAENDWIAHDGGDCPVDPAATVEIKLRDGSVTTMTAKAVNWRYGTYIFEAHCTMPALCEVVAYRIVALSAPQGDDKTILKELRPSKKAMDRIDWIEQANATGIAAARDMLLGSTAAPQGEVERLLGWQPIDTAPRDGTWFIACASETGWRAMRIVQFRYDDDRLPTHGEGNAWPSAPTHWMPLPAYPAALAQPKGDS